MTVHLAWTYTDAGQDGFALWRCTGSGGADCTPSTSLGLPLGPAARSATDATVVGGTRYCYTVQATLSGASPSPPSTPPVCLTPATPGVGTHLGYNPPPTNSFTNVPMSSFSVRVLDGYNALATSSPVTITVALASGAQTAIPQSALSLVSVDSAETDAEFTPGTNALDADPLTTWLTQYSTGSPDPYPHTIIVNLGATYPVTGIIQTPRQENLPDVGPGTIAQYELSLSLDGATWGSPVATGTWPYTATPQTVVFMARTAKYVKLVGLSEGSGGPWAAIGQLTVLQTPAGGGTLAGVTMKPAVSGVASFTPAVTQAGTYTMQATAPGLVAVEAPFLVSDQPTPNTAYAVRHAPR